MKQGDGRERMAVLDIIRGFALIGILVVNVHLMTSLSFYYMSFGMKQVPEAGTVDYWISLIVEFFVEGSFISIFSILFGIGFYLFMTKAKSKGWQEKKLFVRRLLILGLFGLGHLIFFWIGDILFYYAVSGFALLLFYKVKDRTLLIWSAILLTVFYTLYASQIFIPESFQQSMQTEGETAIAAASQAYSQAVSFEWWLFRLNVEVPLALGQVVFLIPYVLGLFLLGFYTARKGWFRNLSANRPLFKKIAAAGLVLALPFWAGMTYVRLQNDLGADMSAYFMYDLLLRLGALPLAMCYISIITLLVTSGKFTSFFKRIEAMGRMALTNYLSHTVLVVFFVHTTGLFGELPVWGNMLLAASVIMLQLWWSPLLLKKYQYGPLEALWRKGTYAGAVKTSLRKTG
ncbi:DUF418 domain-containing protein [Alkalicoccus halolimnae]|uniref:DUF418 domain-containing protein n=1 Tax=Alkalicoccus halolimnae TaxID=1667239 RepID=A0A5C7F4P0_9BACI|nr:DUF418 domain-containing protein [Alkalicoccus halolimnae]TXF85602.1 DUF418 domain-containing protein [Alkalicoccus halolimnae]